jgi:transcriptional regulator with XRE-family HTH domain
MSTPGNSETSRVSWQLSKLSGIARGLVVEDITPGARIRDVRKRRGMTQRELAAASGLSLSVVKKIEQGTYGPLRLQVRRKLAVALDVTATALDSAPDAPVPPPQDARQWEPVVLALQGRHDREPSSEPTLEGLRAELEESFQLLLGSRLDQLGAMLPPMLADADALVAGSVNGAQVQARILRAQVRQITGSLMLHTWQFDAAEEAFAAALADAPDALTAMAVVDERSWGLIRQGRVAETSETALRWAADHEPKMSAGPDELAAYGRLMVRASMAAVRDNRADEADETLRLARMAAAGIGRDLIVPHAPWHVFGPVTVQVFAAESAMIRDRPEAVLAIGRRLAGTRPAIPLSRFAPSFRLDIAHAHALLRQDDQAVAILQELRRSRPQWFPRQRYAADILETLFRHRRTLSQEMRELADAVRLPL